LKIHFNIINPFTPRFSILSLSFKHPHQKLVCTPALPLRTTCLAHRIFVDFITWMIFGEEYRADGSSFYSLLYSPVTLSRLSLNAFFNTLLSNFFGPFFSLSERDQTSHPYKITINIIFLCILIFIFLYCYLEDKMFCTER
jgi:dolichol kinase